MGNKNWIIVVLIILVALFAYNFTSITGEITKEQVTKITVSPTSVSFDKYETMKLLTINIKVGTIGIDKGLELYRVTPTGNERVGTEKIAICNNYQCDKNAVLTYKLGMEVGKGTYFFRGERNHYDANENDIKFDSNKFIVE